MARQLFRWGSLCLVVLFVVSTGARETRGQEQAPPAAVADAAGADGAWQGPWHIWPDRIPPRTSIRRSFGDGVGYDSGFTYLESLFPVWQDPGDLLFGDLRVVNFDGSQLWEFNFGGGGRHYLPELGAILGLNGFYDGRNTNIHFYHQLGVGWEVLGRNWETRGNAYIPVGPQIFPASPFFNPRYVRTNITLDRIFESAMGGVDVEVGRRLPILDRFEPRAYLGYYHYSNDQVQSANGIRGRLEAFLTDKVSVYAQVQNDALFNTTANGGLAIHFGGGRRVSTAALPDRLGQRVVRDPNIILSQQTLTAPATDPATGQPIEVRHASSNAAAGGDGSVERPFQTLAQLQAGSGPNMILFAHGGSTFTGQNITLQSSQRFLGEGIAHSFTASQGSFLLPRATSSSVRPTITGSTGDAITLASNTEVSGFAVASAGDDGIEGVGVNNVNINRNIITSPTDRGINLVNPTGTIVIDANTITMTPTSNEGIFQSMSSGTANLIVSNNIITASGDDSIDIVNTGAGNTSVLVASITGNVITNSGDESISFVMAGTSQLRATIANNQLSTGSDILVLISLLNNATGFAQVARNNFSTTPSTGLSVTTGDTSTMCLQVFGNVTSESFIFSEQGASTFSLEDTLATNTLLGGAVITVDPSIPPLVPFGSCGFPPP